MPRNCAPSRHRGDRSETAALIRTNAWKSLQPSVDPSSTRINSLLAGKVRQRLSVVCKLVDSLRR